MQSNVGKEISEAQHQQIFWLILGVLLLLRIPYTIAIIYLLPIEDQSGGAVYEVGTYLLIALLIWWERDRLRDFHMDSSALFIFILFRPLQTLILAYWKVESPLAFPNPLGLMIWAIAIGLTTLLWQSGFKSTQISLPIWRWLAFGIFIGVSISIAQNFKSFQSISTHVLPASTFISSSINLLYHLGFAPINEEPLFRGFLWGILRQHKWKEGRILAIQAILFTLAHVYFASQYPFMFWVFIPGAALIFGILAWRSRSVASGMLAHGLINGSVYLLASGLISPFH